MTRYQVTIATDSGDFVKWIAMQMSPVPSECPVALVCKDTETGEIFHADERGNWLSEGREGDL